MAYTAPNRDVLRTALARDLRDSNGETFTDAELNDLINAAIVEVSRIYPKEMSVVLSVEQDFQYMFDLEDAYSIFRVELIDPDGNLALAVRRNDQGDHIESGWDYHGGSLFLPAYAANRLVFQDGQTVRVWGYWPRELFHDDTDAFDGNGEAEYAVRAVATLMGYQRLQNDRLLFQQWLTNTGNSDVSPNQLAQTANMYQAQWHDMRNRIRILQRV